jgi:PAS domain S-box-containing protein
MLLGTVAVLCLVMTAVFLTVERRQRGIIVDEVQRRGEVLARSLAAISRAPLLLYNFTALEQNAARVGHEPDVVYALVLDGDGRIAAHSHRPDLVGSPPATELERRAAAAETFLVQEIETPRAEPNLFDFAVPVVVEGQRWGTVRVGVSQARMEAAIRATRAELLMITAFTLLLGGCLAALVTRRIVGPARELAAGAEAISRGDLDQRIAPRASGEIGHLARAFNHMASQLREQRRDLEATHDELRRRYEELSDVKSYADSILGSLTGGVVTLDLEGRVTTMNPAAEQVTGLFAGQAVGRYAAEVFAHAPGVTEVVMEVLATRTAAAEVPLTLRRPNGATLVVALSVAPLRRPEGKDLGVVAQFRDLSAIRELEEQLRRSDRLAALGTMAAGLAHEIKTPAAAIATLVRERQLRRLAADEAYREYFGRRVREELERITTIVEQLLELAGPPRIVRPVPLSPARLLDRAVESLAGLVETKQILVRRDYPSPDLQVPGDPQTLDRALANLVTNALEAMGPGGELGLRVAWADAEPGRVRRRGGPPRAVVVEVRDTGVGIPPGTADRVFNPFFTTKPAGTGLGLALTHKIVEDHGGRIGFESVPGRGTTFRVLLPHGDRAGGGLHV